MKLHEEHEAERQARRILVVQAKDRFYIRLPGFCPRVTDAMKSLIPYERRHPDQGLGWLAEAKGWALNYDDYADLLDLLDQLLPGVPVDILDELPPVDRTKPYELEA